MATAPSPVQQIAEFELVEGKVKAKLHTDVVEEALRDVGSCPLLVVSISGVFRSGKSFLLNLILSYLNSMAKNDVEGWENSGSEIAGIEWARQEGAVTKGIWILKDPIIIQRPDGTKVAVLLMDCQGIHDSEQSTMEMDTLINFISLQIANIHIINLRSNMRSDDITMMQLCSSYSESVTGREDAMFGHLVWLIRDWDNEEKGQRRRFFQDLVATTSSPDVKAAGTGVLQAFKNTTTFMMPPPSDNVRQGSQGESLTVTEDKLGVEFAKCVREFCDLLFRDAGANLSGVQNAADILGEKLDQSDLGLMTPDQALGEAVAYKNFKSATQNVAEKYKPIEDSSVTDPDKIKELMEIIIKEVLADYDLKFPKNKRDKKNLAFRKYREMLEKEWKILAEKHFADAKRAKIEKEGSGEKMKKTLTIMQMIQSALGIIHEGNELEKDVKDDIAQMGGK